MAAILTLLFAEAVTALGPPNNPNDMPGGSSTLAAQEATRDAILRRITIHGVLASVAFVFLFPLGNIMLRALPGRLAFWSHIAAQLLALLVFTGAAILGLFTFRDMSDVSHANLWTMANLNYHPIIGLVIFVALFAQPPLGYMHHLRMKQLGRRQAWSYAHMWNGRTTILLGIVNGGLGMHAMGTWGAPTVAYAIVAVVMVALWGVALARASHKRRALEEVRRDERPAMAERGM